MATPSHPTRTHTFTGCWTCRKRRVKCDGARPTCARCTTARITCAGYGFQFDVPEGVQSKRQRLPIHTRPDKVLKLTNKEIEEHLAEIETTKAKALHKGPFSVLSFSPEGRSGEWLQVVLNEKESIGEIWDVPEEFNRRLKEEGHVGDGTYPLGREDEERVNVSIPGYVPLINLSKSEWKLFEHFNAFVAEEVSSTTGHRDPQAHRHRTLITSIALTQRASNSPAVDPDATASVFHGICSVAAISLARMNEDVEKDYHMQAYTHERLALRHLRLCIERGSKSYQSITAAIMVLMVFDYLNDRGQSLHGHMQAALRSLKVALPRNGVVDTTTITMIEELLQGGVLLQTAPFADLRALRRFVSHHTTYQDFVLPLPLIDCILEMHETSSKAHLLSESQIIAMENRLFACAPKDYSPPYTTLPPRARRIGILCYHSSLIYFSRSIRRLPTSSIQPLVASCLSLLEILEPPQNLPVHSLVAWASVFIGSECLLPDLRTRFLAWCDSRTRFNLSNLKGIREISQLTWGLRGLFGQEVEGMNWFDVVKGGEFFSSEHSMMIKNMLKMGEGRKRMAVEV